MLRPAPWAEIYSHGECKGSNGSTLNSVSGFSFQNHGLLSKEHHSKGLPACHFGPSSPATCVPLVGLDACGSGWVLCLRQVSFLKNVIY